MERYGIVKSFYWKHKSGRTASIYGSLPWTSAADAENWKMVQRGWAIKDNHENTVGRIGRPSATLQELQDLCERLNK